jgi:DNA-directed RNA polymerase specialized sigma24 family protein
MTNGQQTNGIEWMLQNPQIDDDTLAAALQAEYSQGLHSFAYLLTANRQAAGRIVAEALDQAVAGRHRLFPETSLRAWLYAQVYRRCHPAGNGGLAARIRSDFQRLVLRRPDLCAGLSAAFDGRGLTHRQALALALRYGYRFSIDEIASVLQADPQTGRDLLNRARQAYYGYIFPQNDLSGDHLEYTGLAHALSEGPLEPEQKLALEEHLQACSACSEYALRLPELETQLAQAFKPASIPDMNLESGAQPLKGGPNNGRRRLSLPVKELALVGVLLVALMALGRNQGVFDSFDARPTPTPRAEPEETLQPTRTPVATREPTPTPLPTPVFPGVEGRDYFYFDYRIRMEESLESIAQKSGLSLIDIQRLNNLPDALIRFPLDRTIKLVAFRDSGWFDPIPQAPVVDPLPPLSETSTIAEILARVEAANQRQVLPGGAMPGGANWGDFISFSHGGPGIIGNPTIELRVQIFHAGGSNRIVAFSFGDFGSIAHISGNWVFSTSQGPDSNAQPAGYRGEWSESDYELFYFLYFSSYLLELLNASSESDLRVIDAARIANREAILLEISHVEENPALQDADIQVWIDTQTGFILGADFHPDGHPRMSFRVNSLETITDFPPNFFYPPASPVSDFLNANLDRLPIHYDTLNLTPRIEAQQPPPDGLDLSTVPLFFQRPEDQPTVPLFFQRPEDQPVDPTPPTTARFEIYAGDYYLGLIEQPERIVRACTRSQNGMHAAYISSDSAFFNEGLSLYLLSLAPLENRRILSNVYGSLSHAFSPNGDILAYTTCDEFECSIYFVDVETGESTLFLHRRPPISHLVWSPDGDQIAYIQPSPEGLTTLYVLEVSTGDEVFRGSYRQDSGELSPGSPTEAWGDVFPPTGVQSDCHK